MDLMEESNRIQKINSYALLGFIIHSMGSGKVTVWERSPGEKWAL